MFVKLYNKLDFMTDKISKQFIEHDVCVNNML